MICPLGRRKFNFYKADSSGGKVNLVCDSLENSNIFRPQFKAAWRTDFGGQQSVTHRLLLRFQKALRMCTRMLDSPRRTPSPNQACLAD